MCRAPTQQCREGPRPGLGPSSTVLQGLESTEQDTPVPCGQARPRGPRLTWGCGTQHSHPALQTMHLPGSPPAGVPAERVSPKAACRCTDTPFSLPGCPLLRPSSRLTGAFADSRGPWGLCTRRSSGICSSRETHGGQGPSSAPWGTSGDGFPPPRPLWGLPQHRPGEHIPQAFTRSWGAQRSGPLVSSWHLAHVQTGQRNLGSCPPVPVSRCLQPRESGFCSVTTALTHGR